MYHSRFKGSYYAAGFRYGETLSKKGLNPLAGIETGERRRYFADECIPVYREAYPEILEEIKGMADGLGIHFMDIAEFLLPMYCFPYGQKCSCFAFSADGTTILGKNSDFSTEIEKLCDSTYYCLEGTYSFVGNTTAWTEIEDGVNEHGLAAGLTFIYPTRIAPGLNAGMLVRYLLEKCRTVSEALESLARLPIASPQTLTLADRSGEITVVECNCEKISVIRPQSGKPYVFTTNHFVTEAMQGYQYSGVDDCRSHERYETMKKAFGICEEYSMDFARELLSGKKGFLCQYDRKFGLDTVWSSIYNLSDGTVYRAEGNPSRRSYRQDSRIKW